MKKSILHNARKSKGYSQSYIASEIGISRAGYTNIENEKRQPSVKVAKKIAQILDIDWTVLFQEKK